MNKNELKIKIEELGFPKEYYSLDGEEKDGTIFDHYSMFILYAG